MKEVSKRAKPPPSGVIDCTLGVENRRRTIPPTSSGWPSEEKGEEPSCLQTGRLEQPSWHNPSGTINKIRKGVLILPGLWWVTWAVLVFSPPSTLMIPLTVWFGCNNLIDKLLQQLFYSYDCWGFFYYFLWLTTVTFKKTRGVIFTALSRPSRTQVR